MQHRKKIIFLLTLFTFMFAGCSKTNNQNPTQGSVSTSTTDTSSPLHVDQPFHISLLTDKTPNARDIQLTPGGNLLVSSPERGEVYALDLKEEHPTPKVILRGLDRPHGLAFYQGKLFVAEGQNVTRYQWDEANFSAKSEKKLFESPIQLPSVQGLLHFTHGLVFDKSGHLYISIGSTCNTCEEKNPWNATVIVTDQDGNDPQVFSQGLRNAVFLTLNEATDQVWATEMGRDDLGDDLPSDEIDILQKDSHYGWPYCYGKKLFDQNFNKKTADFCKTTRAPLFEIPAHSAPLGLTFISSSQFPAEWQGDLLVAYHGSWNRSTPTGFKVVHIKKSGDNLTTVEDFITGFKTDKTAYGRPVDLTFDTQGNLYISDDQGGRIFKVSK